jgi:hypothetical protein
MDSKMPKTPVFFLTCGKSLGLLDPAVATAKATAALAELDLRWKKSFSSWYHKNKIQLI